VTPSDVPTSSLAAALLAVLVGTAALALLLWLAATLARLLPLSRRRREMTLRVLPVAGAALSVLYLIAATAWLFGRGSPLPPAVSAVLLAMIGWVSWPLSRDVLAGVAVKAGRVCTVGDHIDTGTVSGRVTRMGTRVLTVETVRGEEAIIPYGGVASAAIRRRPVLEGIALHAFRLPVPPGLGRLELERRVTEAAFLCHWASVKRKPEVSVSEAGDLEITVFALDDAHAPAVETAVRRALASEA
jgi:small-conductance mechanosensitive channel